MEKQLTTEFIHQAGVFDQRLISYYPKTIKKKIVESSNSQEKLTEHKKRKNVLALITLLAMLTACSYCASISIALAGQFDLPWVVLTSTLVFLALLLSLYFAQKHRPKKLVVDYSASISCDKLTKKLAQIRDESNLEVESFAVPEKIAIIMEHEKTYAVYCSGTKEYYICGIFSKQDKDFGFNKILHETQAKVMTI